MLSFKFPAAYKLRSKNEFENVFKKKKLLCTSYIVAYYSKNKFDYPRLGIITSKKNLKLSVNRNYLRRIIKEHFRTQKNALGNNDIVFVATKKTRYASKQDLHKCCMHLLKKLLIA